MLQKKDGTKTIKLGIYFFTNVDKKNESEGISLPKKTCWDCGVIHSVSNNRHGIRSGPSHNFQNIEDIPNAIKDVLKKSGVRVILSAKDKEYKDALKKMNESILIKADS